MPSYTRPTKSTGQNVFIDGVPLPASDLEGEFTAINTALGLSAPSTDIDSSVISDYSVSATEQKTQTDPGSGSGLSAPTTLDGEIERLRYTISRLEHGIAAPYRYDGSSNVACAWPDFPARGPNLALNGGFEAKTTGSTAAPEGWILVDTPTTCSQATADVSLGVGSSIRIVVDAANEGISQNFVGLKASTRYLVSVKAAAAIGTAKMTVSGADVTSQFRDITLTTTSTTFVTLSAIVQTDATPAALVVSLLGVDVSDDVNFDHFAIHECAQDFDLTPRGYVVTNAVTTATVGHYTVGASVDSGCTLTVVAPAPGFIIRVVGSMPILSPTAGNSAVYASIKENTTIKATTIAWADAGNGVGMGHVEYVNAAPVPGTAYTYTMTGYASNAAADRNPPFPEGTATTYIRAWVERL